VNETDICIRALRFAWPADRAGFLDSACGGDPELRRRVEEQLAEIESAGDAESLPEAATGTPDDGVATAVQSRDRPPAEGADNEPPLAGPAPWFEYFRVERVLGEGGMGTVYLAEDTRLGRSVAVKTLRREFAANPAAKDRFLREARAAAKVDHDHVVPIFYVGEADGVPFLAMPFLQGESLEARIRRGRRHDFEGPLPIREAMQIAGQAALGLAAAHNKGLIHRDVKPGNIWLEAPTGRAKILDFGLARGQHENTGLTASGAVVGTPAYMAPEQARGGKIDARADLFSLGCVLYEMVTGTRPFKGADMMAILTSLALHNPDPPRVLNPDCPADLSALTMALLAKSADQRPASADAVADCLAVIAGAKADGPVNGDAPAARRAAHPRRRLARLAAVGLLLFAGILTVIFRSDVHRVITNRGNLMVDVADRDVEVRIVQDGRVVHERTAQREFTLDAGPGTVEFLSPDGHALVTRAYDLGRNGTAKVSVTAADLAWAHLPPHTDPGPKSAEPDDSGADRRAAEQLLSVGARLWLDGGAREYRTKAELPNGPFRLTGVNLHDSKSVQNSDLTVLKDCRHLAILDLIGTHVDDAGLANFKNCKSFTNVCLGGTGAGDAGLSNFAGCEQLQVLDLNATRVTDVGLAYFRGCKNLIEITLGDTRVTDDGIAFLAGCPKLRGLNLAGTQVSPEGFACFKDCSTLSTLHLERSRATDASLAYFQNSKGLATLTLHNTRVTNDGLAHLKEFKSLGLLTVQGTQVTIAGLEELRKAIPQCQIGWDRGVFEPVPPGKVSNDRFVAVSLKAKASATLADSLDFADNSLKSLPTGRQTFVGVPFDIAEGIFQLDSSRSRRPDRIDGIKMDGTAMKLHFLQGIRGYTKDGTVVAKYVVHYDDGTTADVDVVYDRDVTNWWRYPEDKGLMKRPAAWEGENPSSKGAAAKIRLYVMTWENPKPGRPVSTIDFVAPDTGAALGPFCVAITAERN
jgi:eukaryotic-like serine/threonine-protein kinase